MRNSILCNPKQTARTLIAPQQGTFSFTAEQTGSLPADTQIARPESESQPPALGIPPWLAAQLPIIFQKNLQIKGGREPPSIFASFHPTLECYFPITSRVESALSESCDKSLPASLPRCILL